MLQEWKAMEKPEEEEIRARLAAAKEKLAKQQLLIKEQKIPVLVLMEGWGTAGKGSVIGQVIQNIDPRFFKVESMGEKSEEECRKPFLYRYFRRIPEEGKFVFRKRSLEEVMHIISRWYNVEAVFQNESLKKVSFSGNLKRYDDFEHIVSMLEMTGGIRFKVEGRKIFITEK